MNPWTRSSSNWQHLHAPPACWLLIKSSQMAASPLAGLIEHFSLTAIAHGFAYSLASWLAKPAHSMRPCYLLTGRLEWEVAQTEILFHFPWPALAKTCKVGVNGSRWWLFIVIFMTALHTNTPRRRADDDDCSKPTATPPYTQPGVGPFGRFGPKGNSLSQPWTSPPLLLQALENFLIKTFQWWLSCKNWLVNGARF